MAPLIPHWPQPSHPKIQRVIFSTKQDYNSKSISLIHVAPFGIYASLETPLTTRADKPTYATVQVGKDEHINLNSDLVYINHSCEPSVIFHTTPNSLLILAGPHGLHPGDELTFFYPSNEWDMAQPFACNCGTKSCCGFISGAKHMSVEMMSGKFVNAHIWALLGENEREKVEFDGADSSEEDSAFCVESRKNRGADIVVREF